MSDCVGVTIAAPWLDSIIAIADLPLPTPPVRPTLKENIRAALTSESIDRR